MGKQFPHHNGSHEQDMVQTIMDVRIALHLFGQKMYCEDWCLSFPVFDSIKKCGQKKSQVGQHKTQTKFCIVFQNLFIGVV